MPGQVTICCFCGTTPSPVVRRRAGPVRLDSHRAVAHAQVMCITWCIKVLVLKRENGAEEGGRAPTSVRSKKPQRRGWCVSPCQLRLRTTGREKIRCKTHNNEDSERKQNSEHIGPREHRLNKGGTQFRRELESKLPEKEDDSTHDKIGLLDHSSMHGSP